MDLLGYRCVQSNHTNLNFEVAGLANWPPRHTYHHPARPDRLAGCLLAGSMFAAYACEQ